MEQTGTHCTCSYVYTRYLLPSEYGRLAENGLACLPVCAKCVYTGFRDGRFFFLRYVYIYIYIPVSPTENAADTGICVFVYVQLFCMRAAVLSGSRKLPPLVLRIVSHHAICLAIDW